MGINFDQHSYLLTSPQLTEIHKKKFSRYLSNEITEAETQDAIRFLMECLCKHFNQKVWVLIDEYDSAFHEAYTTFGSDKANPYQFSSEFEKVLKLFRKLLGSALKSDDHRCCCVNKVKC